MFDFKFAFESGSKRTEFDGETPTVAIVRQCISNRGAGKTLRKGVDVGQPSPHDGRGVFNGELVVNFHRCVLGSMWRRVGQFAAWGLSVFDYAGCQFQLGPVITSEHLPLVVVAPAYWPERGSVGALQARPVPARPVLLGVQRGFYQARTSLQKPGGSQ